MRLSRQALRQMVEDSTAHCPGGEDCACCHPGCNCGCRNVCPRFRYEVYEAYKAAGAAKGGKDV